MNIKNKAWAAVAFVVSIALTGCGASTASSHGSSGSSTSNRQYIIGADFPLSGINAVYGQIFSEATKLAQTQVVSSLHLLPNLKIDYVDSQALPQPAVVGWQKLVSVDRVPYVLSAFSGVTTALGPLATRDQVVQVNGGGVSPNLGQLGAYTLNDIPLISDEIKTMLPYLNKQNIKSMDIVYTDDSLGIPSNKLIKKVWSGLGGTVPASYEIAPTDDSFTSLASQIASGNPDAVYLVTYGNQDTTLITQLRNQGYTGKIVSYSGLDFPGAISLKQAQGALFTSERVNFNASDKITQTFVKGFKKAYHTMPEYYQANYYNAVLIYADAVAYINKHHETYNGSNILAAIHAIKTFHVVGTNVTFRKNGTVSMPIEINEIKNDSTVVIKN